MNRDDQINVIEKLIETCRDGEQGYKDAAEHVADPQLKSQFLEHSSERRHFLTELQGELSRLGEVPKKEPGSVAGRVHRAWMDFKANVAGGDKTILSSVEQGEDSAKKAYQGALQKPLPAHLETMIRHQAQSVMMAHDQVKRLRDTQAA